MVSTLLPLLEYWQNIKIKKRRKTRLVEKGKIENTVTLN
jgi:hypothetical protein